MEFNPQNILINNFGQIGDVILSLPALKAVRARFPEAQITVLVGKSAAQILEIVDFVDEKIVVDRVRLLHGNPAWSVWQILKLLADVRRRKFDFVIDLHSLYETNLLGFLSGAKKRLYSRRDTRSLDRLSNFQPAPPALDKSKHFTDYYLDTLSPLGIEGAARFTQIAPRAKDLETTQRILAKRGIDRQEKLYGIFPGAGNPSRRWSLENFARLAAELSREKNVRVLIFLGPEEKPMRAEIENKFPPDAIIVEDLSLLEFAAALSLLDVLISNDTGAIHIGAMVGAGIVLILDESAPRTFIPLSEKVLTVSGKPLAEITVEEVSEAVKKLQARESSQNKISDQYQTQSG